MLTRLARWWLGRADRRVRPATRFDECICGVTGSHRVIATFNDAIEAEVGTSGGTYMSADFCPAHCPGGCQQGCAPAPPPPTTPNPGIPERRRR